MKILILTATAGGGHTAVANTINGKLKHESKVIDIFDFYGSIPGNLIVGSYLSSIRKFPYLYYQLYKQTNNPEVLDIMKSVTMCLASKILEFIWGYKPDVIICTHPFASQIVSRLKELKMFSNIKSILVLTDHTSHRFWIHDNINYYIVPCHQCKDNYIKIGVPSHKIYDYGIPIDDKFYAKNDKIKLVKKLDLNCKKTILIMGGSLGYGNLLNIFNELKNNNLLQLVVIAGKNVKLKSKLDKVNTDHKILGFVNNVDEYMDVSDIVITKPGGVTITEAIAKKKTILIDKPIPGQEEENQEFLLKNNLGFKIENTKLLNSLVFKSCNELLYKEFIKESSIRNILELIDDI